MTQARRQTPWTPGLTFLRIRLTLLRLALIPWIALMDAGAVPAASTTDIHPVANGAQERAQMPSLGLARMSLMGAK